MARRYARVGLMVAGLAVLAGCNFHMSREEARAGFPPEHAPEFAEYSVDGRTMAYVSVGSQRTATAKPAATGEADRGAPAASDDEQPLIVFIHGSPGGWSAYIDYLQSPVLLRSARLVAVDRAGYGASNAGRPVPSLAAQARLLGPILENESRPVLLVGHSYGGPVAVQLALDYPEKVGGMVLIAASVDPALEEWRWFNQAAEWALVRFILPAAWDVSNQELKPLRGDLEAILERWDSVRGPVALVHGEEDGLVPVANVDFARGRLQAARVAVHRYADEDHFILWNRPAEMIEIILATLERMESAPTGAVFIE